MRAHKKKDTFENDQFLVRKCPICGKVFCPAPMHVYHLAGGANRARVCSYSCMLESQRRHEAGKKKTGRPKKQV